MHSGSAGAHVPVSPLVETGRNQPVALVATPRAAARHPRLANGNTSLQPPERLWRRSESRPYQLKIATLNTRPTRLSLAPSVDTRTSPRRCHGPPLARPGEGPLQDKQAGGGAHYHWSRTGTPTPETQETSPDAAGGQQ